MLYPLSYERTRGDGLEEDARRGDPTGEWDGVDDGTRTHDLLIRSQML